MSTAGAAGVVLQPGGTFNAFHGRRKASAKPNDLKITKKINVSRLAFLFNTDSVCMCVCS